jgi:hypothetical protein
MESRQRIYFGNNMSMSLFTVITFGMLTDYLGTQGERHANNGISSSVEQQHGGRVDL